MKDLVKTINDIENLVIQTRKVIAKNKPNPSKKHLRLIPFESKFLRVWKKYDKNKKLHQKEFLKTSIEYVQAYKEWNKRGNHIKKLLAPYRNKTIRLLRKKRNLEQKYRNSNEILQDIYKLRKETNPTWEKFLSKGKNMSKIHKKVKHSKEIYLKTWEKFSTNDQKYQEKLLKSSDAYARTLQLLNNEYAKYEAIQKKPEFKKKIRTNKKIRTLEARLK